MPKRSPKLTPIPKPTRRREPKANGTATAPAAAEAGPGLSRIAPALHALAVPIGDLQFDPANARRHPEKNLDALKGSLAVYGQVKPVVVRKDTGVVIAGNGTLAAALAMNWTHLAAVYVTMDAATAAGYSIADNRASDLATWDAEALDVLLREVSTGNDERLDAMLSELAKAEGLLSKEEKPEPPAGDQTGELVAKYQVLVDCATEMEQAALLERLTAEGLVCRSLIA